MITCSKNLVNWLLVIIEIDEDIIEEIDDAENFMSTDKRNDKRGKGGNIHTSSEDMLAS